MVAPRTQPRSRARGVRIEVNDLHRGVHAGIGAAGSRDFDRMIGNGGQRGFDDRLDAQRMRLRLPAAKALPSYSRPRAMRGMEATAVRRRDGSRPFTG